MSGQTFSAGNKVKGVDLTNIVYQNEDGVSAAATTSGSDTTTSSSFANLAGTGSVTSFSFTKALTSTRLIVRLEMGWQNATAVSDMSAGVNVNSTDYEVARQSLNTTTNIGYVAGFVIISGLTAGVYTVQGRWKRRSGSGTPTRSSTEWLAISCAEIT